MAVGLVCKAFLKGSTQVFRLIPGARAWTLGDILVWLVPVIRYFLHIVPNIRCEKKGQNCETPGNQLCTELPMPGKGEVPWEAKGLTGQKEAIVFTGHEL